MGRVRLLILCRCSLVSLTAVLGRGSHRGPKVFYGVSHSCLFYSSVFVAATMMIRVLMVERARWFQMQGHDIIHRRVSFVHSVQQPSSSVFVRLFVSYSHVLHSHSSGIRFNGGGSDSERVRSHDRCPLRLFGWIGTVCIWS